MDFGTPNRDLREISETPNRNLREKSRTPNRNLREKSVSFAMKQEPQEDQSLFLLSDEEEDDEIGDEDGVITPRRAVPKGPLRQPGEFEAWSKKPDMEIIRYGPQNAPMFRWRQGTIDDREKENRPEIKTNRRGEEMQQGRYVYTKRTVKGIQGVCWNWDESLYTKSQLRDDPYGLDFIERFHAKDIL